MSVEHICIGPVLPVYMWLFQNSTNPGLQGIYGCCMQHDRDEFHDIVLSIRQTMLEFEMIDFGMMHVID